MEGGRAVKLEPYIMDIADFSFMAVQIGHAVPKGGNEKDVRMVITRRLWMGFVRMLRAIDPKGEPPVRFYGAEVTIVDMPGLGYACTAIKP